MTCYRKRQQNKENSEKASSSTMRAWVFIAYEVQK